MTPSRPAYLLTLFLVLAGLAPAAAQSVVLLPSESSEVRQSFGTALAADGDFIVVGAPGQFVYEPFGLGLPAPPGLVSVFRRTGEDAWEEEALLRVPGSGENDFFGIDVALDGTTALVRDGSSRSHILVYERDGGAWPQTSSLSLSGPTYRIAKNGTMAVHGDRALISVAAVEGGSSDPKFGFLFRRDAEGEWGLETILQPFVYDNGITAFTFRTVAMGDDLVIASSTGGRVVTYEPDDTGAWRITDVFVVDVPLVKFPPLAYDDGRLAVTALAEDRVIIYEQDKIYEQDEAGGWAEVASIERPLGTSPYRFGSSLVFDGDRLLINQDGGAVLAQRQSDEVWSTTLFQEAVSFSVALTDSDVVLGDTRATITGENNGAVYLFDDEGGQPVAAEPSAPGDPARLLSPAYPNPFARSTTLGFALAEGGPVRLVVYDLLGREVARLADRPMAAGEHTVTLDGARLPAGSYVVRLEAEGRVETQRVTLVR